MLRAKYYKFVLPLFIVSSLFLLAVIGSSPLMTFNKLPCQYSMIFRNNEGIDYVVVGSSRAMQGIDARILTNNSINMSRNFRGIGQMYYMVEELLKNRKIEKGIIVQISHNYFNNRKSSLYYYGYYPNFEKSVSLKFIISDFSSRSTEPLILRISDTLRQIFYFYDNALTNLFSIDVNKFYLPQKNNCFKRDNKQNQPRLDADLSKIEKRYGSWSSRPKHYWNPTFVNENRQNYYIQKFIQLAKKNNIEARFVFVPRYLFNELDSERLTREIDIDDMQISAPPKAILEKIYNDGFSDPGHMNIKGRTIFSYWLSQEMHRQGEVY